MGIGELAELMGAAGGAVDRGRPPATQRVIEIDGSELPEDIDGLVESVVVVDRLRMPRSFVLVIRDFKHGVLKEAGIEIGGKVRISTTPPGGESPEPIFSGEVTSIEAEYDVLGMRAVVRGYDLLHRLTAGRKTKLFENVTYADVAKEIAEGAGLSAEVGDSGGTFKHVIQANTSDLDFLYQLAHRVGFDLRVDDATLTFKKPGDSSDAPGAGDQETIKPTQLVWSRNLLEFRARMSAVAQVTEVKVRGWDVTKGEAVMGHAPAETTSAGISMAPAELAKAVGGETLMVVDRPVDDQGAADDLAKAIADQVASAAYEATAVAVGSPELKAGQAVSISEVDPSLKGDWVISTARHEFGSGPYRTHLEFSGRQDRSLHGLVAGGLSAPAARTTIPGVVNGIVEDIEDPDGLGRVRVRYPWLAQDAVGWWARVATFGARQDQGMIWIPQKGDEVVVAFVHGDINYPIVVGSLWNGQAKPPVQIMEGLFDGGKVTRTGIVSPGDHKIVTYDAPDDAGIMLITGDTGYRLLLDQSGKRVKLHSEGTLEIHAAGDLAITAGGAIKIEAGANMTIKGAKVAIN